MIRYICPVCCRMMTEKDIEEQLEKGIFPGLPKALQMCILLFLRYFGMSCPYCMSKAPKQEDLLVFDDEETDISKLQLPDYFRHSPTEDGMGYMVKYQKRSFGTLIAGIFIVILGSIGFFASDEVIVPLCFIGVGVLFCIFGVFSSFSASRIRFYKDRIDVSYGLRENADIQSFALSSETRATASYSHGGGRRRNSVCQSSRERRCESSRNRRIYYKVEIQGSNGIYQIGRDMDEGQANYMAMIINWYVRKHTC